MEYNKEVSEIRNQEERAKRFIEWCIQNGVKFNGIDPLAYFGPKGELRGMVATRDIEPYEAVLVVPHKIMITTPKIRNNVRMKLILDSCPPVFHTSGCAEYYTLVAFILRERALKEKSFYHPFFEMCTDIEAAITWKEEDLKSVRTPQLRQDMLNFEKILKTDWEVMSTVLKQYPKVFGK